MHMLVPRKVVGSLFSFWGPAYAFFCRALAISFKEGKPFKTLPVTPWHPGWGWIQVINNKLGVA